MKLTVALAAILVLVVDVSSQNTEVEEGWTEKNTQIFPINSFESDLEIKTEGLQGSTILAIGWRNGITPLGTLFLQLTGSSSSVLYSMLSCRNVPETFNLANEVVSAFSKTWRLILTSEHLRISVNGVDQLKVTFADDCSPGWNSWDRQADSAQFNSIDSASKRYRVIAKEGSGSGSEEEVVKGFELVDEEGAVTKPRGLLLYNGATVCDDYWTNNNSLAICKEMGYDTYSTTWRSMNGNYVEWSIQRGYKSVMHTVSCQSTEWDECSFETKEGYCSHFEDIYLDCEAAVVRCDEGQARCANQKQCIRESFVCDGGEPDCDDGSDEANCTDSGPDECDEGQAQCANGQCIRESYVCDGGAPDCDDGSDEANCPDSGPEECDEGQAQCANGQCIRESYVCDGGAPDCADGSDEANCPDSGPEECEEGQAQCANGQCIRESYVCDGGAPDCADGSDEANCTAVDCSDAANYENSECYHSAAPQGQTLCSLLVAFLATLLITGY